MQSSSSLNHHTTIAQPSIHHPKPGKSSDVRHLATIYPTYNQRIFITNHGCGPKTSCVFLAGWSLRLSEMHVSEADVKGVAGSPRAALVGSQARSASRSVIPSLQTFQFFMVSGTFQVNSASQASMITSLNITTKRWHVRDSKVKRSNKKRFELCLGCEVLLFLTIAQHPHVFEGLRFVPSASSIELRKEEDGEVMIRASQGHSMKVSRGKWQTQGCNPGYL